MRRAMADAEVGDDVFGDDPTVNRLERSVAERLDKEAALFVTSGTQANLCALLAHCGRGDEYIAGEAAHAYRWEAGGGAVAGGIQPQTVPMLADGLPDPGAIEAAVKPDDPHFARTRLLCLENTKDGCVQSVERMSEATSVGAANGLALHLDGARMWNAAVELGVSGAELAEQFDTVSMCLSKGLGAPAGSLLCGPQRLIAEARRWRKLLGGAMRQSGVLAAAGLYALEHNVERLADDHANAAALAEGLDRIDGVEVVGVATNMVFIELDGHAAGLRRQLEDRGVLTLIDSARRRSVSRLVTHLDVTSDDIATVVDHFNALLSYPGAPLPDPSRSEERNR